MMKISDEEAAALAAKIVGMEISQVRKLPRQQRDWALRMLKDAGIPSIQIVRVARVGRATVRHA